MKKLILLTLAALGLSLIALAQTFQQSVAYVGTLNVASGGGGGGGIVLLVAEDFETSTASNTWTRNAAQNWRYATAPAPLVDSFSWNGTAVGSEAYTNFSASTDIWAYAQCNISTLADGIDIFQLRDSSDVGQSKVRANANGSVRFLHFATTPTSAAGIISAGNTFHMWMHYVKGSGANSWGELYVTNSGAKPAAPLLTATNEGSTANISRVAIMGWSGANHIFDKVRVSTNNIGSNPN
jgi:hypothetical protein